MENKKDTIWITIPDEASPMLEAPVEELRKSFDDRVQNRVFWGAGFIALMVFSVVLFAPQELAQLMQAQFFDGNFQVVPDYETQQSAGELFGGTGGEGEGEGEGGQVTTTETTQNGSVVEAESEAVQIQIEPLEEQSGQEAAPAEGAQPAEETSQTGDVTTQEATSAETVGAEAEAQPIGVVEPVSGGEGEGEGEGEAVSDANLALIQALTQQINDLKEEGRQNNQQIQDLMQLIQDQASGGLRGSASETQGGLNQQPSGGTFGQPTGLTQTPGTYRYNTHTVTISPYDVLAQNQQVQLLGLQAIQANVGGLQPYSNQNLNPVLSGVQNQPDTGPAESLLFAFLAVSLAVLSWGILRAARA